MKNIVFSTGLIRRIICIFAASMFFVPYFVFAAANSSHLQYDFNRIAKSLAGSVVSITAIRDARAPVRNTIPGGAGFVPPFSGGIKPESIGSGIIVDSRGYIITNYHVIEKAAVINVSVAGTNPGHYKAELIATDISSDIAILKINPAGFIQPAVLGDSDKVIPGDWVLAIGSAFGFEQTVTAGIISAMNRNLLIEGRLYNGLMQTDCAINKGNSGGPLINMDGEIIAVNTAIYAPEGVSTGVGFAIPVNRLKAFIGQLFAGQTVAFQPAAQYMPPIANIPVRGTIPANFYAPSVLTNQWGQGILNAGFSPPVSQSQMLVNDIIFVAGRPLGSGWLGVHLNQAKDGLIVTDVIAGSPADIGGIQRGDLIVECNGIKISDLITFDGFIDKTEAGQRICLAVIRTGKRKVIYLRTGVQQ